MFFGVRAKKNLCRPDKDLVRPGNVEDLRSRKSQKDNCLRRPVRPFYTILHAARIFAIRRGNNDK
jgi:hypothetical protein